MTEALEVRMKPYIQPFERHLAIEELKALTGATAVTRQDGVHVVEAGADVVPDLIERLTYWESVGTSSRLTRQVLREATAISARKTPVAQTALELPELPPRVPTRRSLRYGPHGIHEYRGKFFPQLVRALLNIGGVPHGGLVADPMIGSGTTAVEALCAGTRVVGMDMNPLSVRLARTKCALLLTTSASLLERLRDLRTALEADPTTLPVDRGHVSTLAPSEVEYLGTWFPDPHLGLLNRIATTIGTSPADAAGELAWLALSNILRRVSWQRVEDLRVRRRTEVQLCDVVAEFLRELDQSTRTVTAFLDEGFGLREADYDIREADARDIASSFAPYRGEVDAVITSPPYATALPYLDTDRLSLSFLGLLTRSEIRQRDRQMIGNREISERHRSELLDAYRARRSSLPDSVTELVDRIDTLNDGPGVGFRRRNLSALLAKYFLDMRETLHGVRALLKPGGQAFVVVGDSYTTAGGERVAIATADLLGDTAEMLGFTRLADVAMEMLVPRDIHRANSMSTERVLSLRATAQ